MGVAALAGPGLALLLACDRPAAPATYDAFHDAQPVTIQGYAGDAMEPFVTRDGRYLIFNNRNDPPERTDLFYAERIDDRTFVFRGPLAGANSPALDGVASVDAAGELYFITTRSYARDRSTVYRAAFQGGQAVGAAPVPGIAPDIPGIVTFDAEISADGQTVYFADGDFRGDGPKPKTAHLVLARRVGPAFQRAPDSDRVLAAANLPGLDYAPSTSADGLELFFTHVAAIAPDAQPQIYRASRSAPDQPFGAPELVTAAEGFVEAPSLSGNGHRLYFHKRVGDRFVIYEAER